MPVLQRCIFHCLPIKMFPRMLIRGRGKGTVPGDVSVMDFDMVGMKLVLFGSYKLNAELKEDFANLGK